MNELTIIKQQEVLGKDFKVYGSNENPLFLAKDVAEWIDYAWTNDKQTARQVGKMLQTIDEDEKIKEILGCNTNNTQIGYGGLRENTEMWFLTEDGMYEVLMQSRKPIAKTLKKEVKKILKQIRLTGGYIPTSETDDEDALMAKALLIAQKTIEKKEERLKEEIEKRKIAETVLNNVVEENVTIDRFNKIMERCVMEISRKTGEDNKIVWSRFYDFIYSKLSINVAQRQKNTIEKSNTERMAFGKSLYTISTLKRKVSKIKMIKEEEYNKVLQCMKSFCLSYNVKYDDILTI